MQGGSYQPLPMQGVQVNVQVQGFIPNQGMPMNTQQQFYTLGKQNMLLVDNPLFELSTAKVAYIKQQVEILEMLTGCETANRYHVYILNQANQYSYLFKCKEESSCCDRNCCPSNARPFLMKVKHVHTQFDTNDDFSTTFAEFVRPFKCTCCCLARPEMTGVLKANHDVFGKVVEPWTMCDPLIDVYDRDNKLKWKVTCDCCQCGFCCRAKTCGKCSDVVFNIYEGSDTTLKGPGRGVLIKKFAGIQEFITDADTFELTFPIEATPEEKLMLIGSVLMVDYRYYEDNGGNKNKTAIELTTGN